MTLKNKYEKSLTEQWCLRFKTKHPADDYYDGIVTHIKPTFIVMREEVNFELDGVIVLPKRFLKGFRDGPYEQCSNQILRHNGALKKLRPVKWLAACETLPQIIAELLRRQIWPGVEAVAAPDTPPTFYIGPITEAAPDHFSLRCYDAAGKWEKAYTLSYAEVCRIEFASKYCHHFNAYMKTHGGA